MALFATGSLPHRQRHRERLLLAADFLPALRRGFLNKEIIPFGPGLDRGAQPAGLSASAGPSISGLVPILDRHLPAFQGPATLFAVYGNPPNLGIVRINCSKLFLQPFSFARNSCGDIIAE